MREQGVGKVETFSVEMQIYKHACLCAFIFFLPSSLKHQVFSLESVKSEDSGGEKFMTVSWIWRYWSKHK